MGLEGWILVIILAIIILFLSISIFLLLKKAELLPKKDKDIIIFTIDMYLQYGEELNITSDEQHDKVVKELERVKNKLKK